LWYINIEVLKYDIHNIHNNNDKCHKIILRYSAGFGYCKMSYLGYNNNHYSAILWINGIMINVSSQIFIYEQMTSAARFALYARNILAMNAETCNFTRRRYFTLVSAAKNKIYESLQFLKNWRQRSILLAKCNIKVLKSVRDGNVASPYKQQ